MVGPSPDVWILQHMTRPQGNPFRLRLDSLFPFQTKRRPALFWEEGFLSFPCQLPYSGVFSQLTPVRTKIPLGSIASSPLHTKSPSTARCMPLPRKFFTVRRFFGLFLTLRRRYRSGKLLATFLGPWVWKVRGQHAGTLPPRSALGGDDPISGSSGPRSRKGFLFFRDGSPPCRFSLLVLAPFAPKEAAQRDLGKGRRSLTYVLSPFKSCDADLGGKAAQSRVRKS